ncbi:crustacean hyperglycemic hormone B-like [Panulirus ornatus]|uniref:crustacean hyperglycemic hormone B-like n=1 Tax=Panulirus ornatus TaxID=150431 RepID=UPI003A88C936
MATYTTMWLAKVVVVTMVLMSSGVTGRSSSGLVRLEKLLSSMSSSSSSTPLGLESGVEKRTAFDETCKGVYDRALFLKLDTVCDDCYNLYRKSNVGTECRLNCYSNMVFHQCLHDLLLVDVVDEYFTYVQRVGK